MTRFLSSEQPHDPRRSPPSPAGVNEAAGAEKVDFAAVLAEARANAVCAECGSPLDRWRRAGVPFCSPKHRLRFRDRRRYAENPERERAKSRRYYEANRERVLAKAAAQRGRERLPALRHCSECGAELTGQQRVTCGSSACKDKRFRRLQPESYAAREAAKVERRRERRRAGGSSSVRITSSEW